MSHQAIRIHGGTLNAYYLSEENHSEKGMYCMNPGMQAMHFGKGKIIEKVKRSMVGSVGVQEE